MAPTLREIGAHAPIMEFRVVPNMVTVKKRIIDRLYNPERSMNE
jgi:hypothetical protein